MRMKVSDQLKNLTMLEDAFKENKISQELHAVRTDLFHLWINAFAESMCLLNRAIYFTQQKNITDYSEVENVCIQNMTDNS